MELLKDMKTISIENILNLVKTNQKALVRALQALTNFYDNSPMSKVEIYFAKQVASYFNKNGEISGIYLENSIDLCERYSNYLYEIALIKEKEKMEISNYDI